MRPRADTNARLALTVFLLVTLAALPLYLVHGRTQWFYLDEWDFLADREATNLRDLLRPHNEHWTTLPILEYRMLFAIFGLRTYVPYQLVVIIGHLLVAALLRVVMRRAGVDPWIATASASLFVLLGAASQNIVWAFQVTWVGSLAFGLTHLVLADHDGPVARRDWLGLLSGLAGVMCSGIAVVLVASVGLAVYVRRGWRTALFHVGPPAFVFGIWWLAFARDSYGSATFDFDAMVDFSWAMGTNVFAQLGQLAGVGVVIATVLAIGLAISVVQEPPAEWRCRAAAPLALSVGAFGFVVTAALGRAVSFGGAYSGRYLHVAAALCLPAIAFAADALVRSWRALLPVMVALFIVGVPANIDALADRDTGRGRLQLGPKDLVMVLPTLDFADSLPPDTQVVPHSPEVTIGWLRARVRSGDLRTIDSPDPRLVARASVALALEQGQGSGTASRCQTVDALIERRLSAGDSLHIAGGPLRVFARDGGFTFAVFDPADGAVINVVLGPVDVRFASDDVVHPAVVCG